MEEKLIHLLPFPHITPYKHCDKVKVHIRGFTFDKNDSLEEVAKILGLKVVEEDRDANIVVLSKTKYAKLTKTKKDNLKGLFKNEKWFLKIVQSGKLSSDVLELVGIQ